ncbi:MAG: hypothetical protein LUI85_12040 [Bacteroides sp.]|nr:hypothetical protein [Bacteroides sp.]
MKKILYSLIIALLALSCSKEDIDKGTDNGNEENTTYFPKLKLGVEESQKDIFEYMIFTQQFEYSETPHAYAEPYDSVVWKISGESGSLITHIDTGYSSTSYYSWSHNFYLPGKYKAYLLGYNNNKIVCSDSVSVAVTNNKEFLNYNWKDIKVTPDYENIGYLDVLKDYFFSIHSTVSQGVPSVTLYARKYGQYEEGSDFIPKSKQILYDYISSLYSTPTYEATECHPLTEEYNKLFTNKEEKAEPLSIWVTPKAKIVLRQYKQDSVSEYEIYAEPGDEI